MNIISNKDFFDDVSGFYDEMINFEAALDRKTNHLNNFITKDMKTAADIGCGSGIDSIALSSLGLNVTGFDISEKMLEKSKENSKKLNKEIHFYNYASQNIPHTFNSKFDFICSLGNTIANINPKELEATIKRFSELLNKNGKLLFHILNYEKIVRENERIINIKKGENNYIIRFYDFGRDTINFNILTFESDNPKQKNLITTNVYPHSLQTIKNLLIQDNFQSIEIYQDLKKTPFVSTTSTDIFLFCSK